MTQEEISILFLHRAASKPIEKIMTSGRDATRTIYCEPALTVTELSISIVILHVHR